MKTIAANIISLLKSILTFIQFWLDTISNFIINVGELAIIAFIALVVEFFGYCIYDAIANDCIGEAILLVFLLMPIGAAIYSISNLIITVFEIICYLCAIPLGWIKLGPIINFLNNHSMRFADTNNLPMITNASNVLSIILHKLGIFLTYAIYPIALFITLYVFKADIQEIIADYNAGNMGIVVSCTLILIFFIILAELIAFALSKAMQASLK